MGRSELEPGVPGRPTSDSVATFDDLLGHGRAQRFVGRTSEQEVFRRVVAGDDDARVLWVHGPGGVGKTSLLGAFERIARDSGVPCASVDLRSHEPRPDAFTDELAARGWAGGADGSVVIVDTMERAGALETWLREQWLPALPVRTTVVLAGRQPPSAPWRADEGWRALLRELRLRNLAPAESHTYLAAVGVEEGRRADVAQATHGHPLALSLVADLARHDAGPSRYHLDDAPDVVATLVQRLVESMPTPAHRRALQVCAHAWMTTEDLLRDVLEIQEAGELAAWLRGLSMIEEGPYGVFPHDLARDVVDADLRWRDPSGYADLHRRIQRTSIDRARRLTGAEQQRVITNVVHAHRRSSATGAFWDYAELGAVYADALRPTDTDHLVAMTRRHQGSEQAALVRYWLERQPMAFRVVRGSGPEPVGFAAVMRLDLADDADRARDPTLAAAWRAMEHRRPLRPGEHATLMRWVVDAEHNQAPSRTLNLGPVLTIQALIRDPAIAWDLLTWIDTGHMDPLMDFIDYARLPEADHRVGDLSYAVFGHDFRAADLSDWMDLLAARELGEPPAPRNDEELLALSFPEFGECVRSALKDLSRADRLATNPLCRCRIVQAAEDEGPPAARLRALISEAVAELDAHPRDARLGRALDRTYLRPAPTQEAAAEVLGVPFSTYRRHLTQGIERVVEKLWRLELGGADQK